jgi:hypothetical protein
MYAHTYSVSLLGCRRQFGSEWAWQQNLSILTLSRRSLSVLYKDSVRTAL